MYTTRNFKTKKELKEAVARGETITVFQPGPFGGRPLVEDNVSVEGPHYPAPHTWYAMCTLQGGIVVKVK